MRSSKVAPGMCHHPEGRVSARNRCEEPGSTRLVYPSAHSCTTGHRVTPRYIRRRWRGRRHFSATDVFAVVLFCAASFACAYLAFWVLVAILTSVGSGRAW